MKLLPTLFVTVGQSGAAKDIEDAYVKWLVFSADILNTFDADTRHHVCHCVRSQLEHMVNWVKYIPHQKNSQLKSVLEYDVVKLEIVLHYRSG